jgi:peptide/nickel transport system substrate-binding protein
MNSVGSRRLIGVFLLLMVSACAGSGTSPTSTGGPSTPASSAPTTTEPEEEGAVLRVATFGDSPTGNWWATLAARHDRVADAVGDVSLFRASGPGLELTPDLAVGDPAMPRPVGSNWVVEQDLVADRTWSDGNPVTAGDLAFYFATVRRLRLAGGHADYFPPEVLAVEAIERDRVRIVFVRFPEPGLWPGSVGVAPVPPAHFWEAIIQGVEEADGLYELDPEDPPRAAGNHIHWVAAVDRDHAYRMLLDDEVDLVRDPMGTDGLDGALLAELAADPGVTIAESVLEPVRTLTFNLRKPPMSDPAFRRAVATVVDRETIATVLGVAPARTFVHPGLWQHSAEVWDPGRVDGDILDRAARIGAAVRTLEESGYRLSDAEPFRLFGPGGRPVPELALLVAADDPLRVAYAEAVADLVALIGVNVRVSPLTPEELQGGILPPLTRPQAEAWDLAIMGWRGTGPVEPAALLVHLFHSEEDSFIRGGTNVTGYASEEFDALADRYRATAHSAAVGLIAEMELRISEDMPQLPLYRETIAEAHRSGLPFHPVMGGIGANPATWPYQRP